MTTKIVLSILTIGLLFSCSSSDRLRISLIILFFFSIGTSKIHSQTAAIDTTQLINDLSDRLKKDQSNYNDSLARTTTFINNFDALIKFTETHGFPARQLGRTRDERLCVTTFTRLTLIHTAQCCPLLITDTIVVNLFLKEINAGRLDRKLLEEVFNFWFFKPCIVYKEKIEFALKIWGLKNIEDEHYQKCN